MIKLGSLTYSVKELADSVINQSNRLIVLRHKLSCKYTLKHALDKIEICQRIL